MSTTIPSRFLKQPLAESRDPAINAGRLSQSRDVMLREIQRLNNGNLLPDQMFLVVVSAAEIKRYDDIIQIFGYKFAEAMLTIRLEDLKIVLPDIDVYQVGFWSLGFVYESAVMGNHEVFFETLFEKLALPVICRGIPVPIKAGVGVCDLRLQMGSAEDLLQSALVASQISGSAASAWIACKEEKDDHRRAFSLIADVYQALTTPDEFELHYQARIELQTRKCVGVEALLRWRHPVHGVVSPGEFIPLVEMTGYIKPLTGWVLSKALAQAAAWHKRGYPLNVSVNVSAKNLEEQDFVPLIQEKLAAYALAPHYLELEFRESSLFSDQIAARTKLDELRAIGVNIATDDFGTGHDSFTGLAANPANIIKIDRSHIAMFSQGSRTQKIVKSMITIAHDLGMIVVAEGVETGDTLELLANLSCDCAQGYFISRPMLAEEFDAWYMKTYARPGD
jgi:EAL domain-containing protein (putative c-di-GMP-specific phosphodiesterase class I)